MTIVPSQECRTMDGWQPVEVPSSSDPHKTYVVMVNPWGDTNEDICECEGYKFRGHCSHQRQAVESLCLWSQVDSDIEQTPVQRKYKVCPQCAGPTRYTMEWIDDD